MCSLAEEEQEWRRRPRGVWYRGLELSRRLEGKLELEWHMAGGWADVAPHHSPLFTLAGISCMYLAAQRLSAFIIGVLHSSCHCCQRRLRSIFPSSCLAGNFAHTFGSPTSFDFHDQHSPPKLVDDASRRSTKSTLNSLRRRWPHRSRCFCPLSHPRNHENLTYNHDLEQKGVFEVSFLQTLYLGLAFPAPPTSVRRPQSSCE
ncbi:hypothetical protein GALMADRAFT_720237 [Galerina marginata CBS 339.88]|uniref:Uncharacterized protein n=1 Tax=Galerina marginata (strain CBS 339.88) TaxID=685588 RepID=A0A067TXE1_GALM3|nr:hypothetical protein GALMADRAFT_720237 [Galerina marginata CBS 339.88]